MVMLATLTLIIHFTQFVVVVATAPGCLQCKKQRCDLNSNCLDGCIPGFAGRTCLHKCPINCFHSICDYDRNTGAFPCIIGCAPGYHGLQCNTPCQIIDEDGRCDRFSGTTPNCNGTRYGENCETSCQNRCGGSVCDNKGKCFDAVCIPGRYGSGCTGFCSSKCKLCHKDTGKCILSADVQDKSECNCADPAHVTFDRWYMQVIIALLCVITVVCLGIFIHIFFWNTTRSSKDKKDTNVVDDIAYDSANQPMLRKRKTNAETSLHD